MKKLFRYLVLAVLTAFGLLTFFLSTSIILDLFGIRAREGNYVLFIVWANFICSLIYLVAAYGLATAKSWTYKILGISTIILVIAFAGFLFYISAGGIHENKTIGAMVFRILLTIGFTFFAFFTINRKSIGAFIKR